MPPVEPNDPEVSPSKSAPELGDQKPVHASHLRFGLYEVDLQKHELRKGGLKLKIPHQSFQILTLLLEKPGEVVSRETLRRELWPCDVFVNFEGSLNVAVQKLRSVLQDTSREPRYIETIPKVGYRFIADIETLRPVAAKMADDTAALGRAPIPSLDEAIADKSSGELSKVVAAPDRHLRHWATAISLLLIVAVATYAGYRYSRRSRHVAETQPQPSLITGPDHARRSVAILGFANVSGDAHNLWLSTAFAEMLATELAAGDQLRTIAGEHVARAKLELSLPSEDSYTTDTLTKIHKDLGCDYVVTGSYVAMGQEQNGRLRLDARVQDALTGETVANIAVAGTRKDLFDLASRAGEQLRAKLGVSTLTETELAEARVVLPSDPEAAQLYSEGLAKLRIYDDVEAGHLFERVIRSQPDYGPAYSALASAWFALGYDARAIAAARKAMDLAHNLPAQARMQTEARYYEMNGEWSQAVEIYARLWQSYPDNLDYSLNLAEAQDAMGKGAEATATLAVLRKLPSPERDDPRIDITEARVAGNLGDYKRAQALANSAAGKAEMTGAGLLLARAKLIDGYASFFLGNLSSAVDADVVAQRVFSESGDLDRSAVASMNIGGVLATQGDITGAKHSIEQALNVFRKQGDQGHLAAALSNLGEMYGIEGDLPKGENLVRQSLAIFTRLNRMNQQDAVTCTLAELLQHQGKFREAKGMLEPLLEHLRSQGNKSVLGAAMQTLGSIAETQGDMATALRMYQDAVASLKETGVKTDYTAAERSLGKSFLREGNFVSAQQALSEALSLDRETGAKTDTALDQVGLAELSLAQAGPVDMGTLRSVIDEFRRQKITDGEIEAEIVLSREIIQEDNFAEAADLLRQATTLSAKSYDPTVRFDVALATAQLRTAQHRFADARREARQALGVGAAISCVRCQLEARLQLGEIELQAGNAGKGRAELRRLEKESRSRGFRMIADHAAADIIGPAVAPRRSSGKSVGNDSLP
jgi:DNA-binding winged helix-turn-helix (wHTH) protein/tetratricopeptide (TPR) repeat protein/TolB-like protein